MLNLPGIAFADTWRDMPDEEKAALDPGVRAACLERYRREGPSAGTVMNFDRGEPGVPRQRERAGTGRGKHAERFEMPAPLDLEQLAEREPEPPRYIIPDRLPEGVGTGVWSDGGVGKSQQALMMAVCLSAGIPYLGVELDRRRVVYLGCEDPLNPLHWRLSRICKYLGINLASLRGWLEVYDLTGHDAVLWTPDRGRGCLTATYGWLLERLEGFDGVLIVDGIADTFAGSENDRSEVKRYVNAVLSLIDRSRGAVFFLGHVDKPGAKNPKASLGFSGSTQWHNAVRSRWFMYAETKGEEENPEPTGAIILEYRKNQYGRKNLPVVRLTWNDAAGLFIPQETGTGYVHLDRIAQDREEQDGILAALNACAAVDYVPAATSGRRTAYHVLEAAPAFPATLRGSKPAVRRFWRHVETLRHRGEIATKQQRGPDRHYIATLIPAGNDTP